jgi:hypothetical protein
VINLYPIIWGIKPFLMKTITIDEILLPTRKINNMQLKPSFSWVLKQITCLAQEPVSTCNASTKHVVEILDTKYDKAVLPGIVRDNCAHLILSHRELLLALLLCFEEHLLVHLVTGNYCLSLLN